MSHSNEPSGSSKPVAKDKDPHNYRKVGYTMIVISVSLVLIGLLVWAIGDNYHFSSDIMANQEIDAMTPKHGFTIVYYDTAQPVGAKLKLLDSASTIDDAQQKQMQYATQNPSINGMVIIFNSTLDSNQKLVKDTVDAIVKAQDAKAQAAKDEAAKVLAAQATNATTTTPAKQATNATTTTPAKQETMLQTNVTNTLGKNQSSSTMTPVTPLTVVNGTNQTSSGIPGVNSEQLGGNTTSVAQTGKKISLSDKIGIITSGK